MGKVARGSNGLRLHCGDGFFRRLPFALTPNQEQIAEQTQREIGQLHYLYLCA